MTSWRHWRTRLILVFAVLGPGFITANVDLPIGAAIVCVLGLVLLVFLIVRKIIRRTMNKATN